MYILKNLIIKGYRERESFVPWQQLSKLTHVYTLACACIPFGAWFITFAHANTYQPLSLKKKKKTRGSFPPL